MHLTHAPLCHLPSAICDSSFETKPMHLIQTSTATVPSPGTLDFPLDAGGSPRALTRRPLLIPGDSEQTKQALKAKFYWIWESDGGNQALDPGPREKPFSL